MGLDQAMEAFRSGFGHGKDKAVEHVDSAISMCLMMPDSPARAIRLDTLRQIRLAVSTIKPDIAGK